MLDPVEWLTEGSLPREIDDHLPIVKARTLLPLDWVKDFVAPEHFYHAPQQHRKGTGSMWKAGYVGDKQHISIQTSLFPSQFACRDDFYAFIERLIASTGPLDDLEVEEAVAWTPPPGCVEGGDLNYRCVVLKLKKSRKAQELRDRIRARVSGFDRFGAECKFHVTVAYVCDPLDREDVTEQIATDLVHELNARYKQCHVPSEPPRPDDNEFAFYGSWRKLSDFVTF